jgi:hypothetical protein
MSTNAENSSSSWPELRTGPIVTGAALFGAGTLIALAGLAVGGTHLFAQRAGQDQVGPGQDGCRGRRRRLAERHLGSRGRSKLTRRLPGRAVGRAADLRQSRPGE